MRERDRHGRGDSINVREEVKEGGLEETSRQSRADEMELRVANKHRLGRLLWIDLISCYLVYVCVICATGIRLLTFLQSDCERHG